MRVQADLSVIAPTEGTVFESDATRLFQRSVLRRRRRSAPSRARAGARPRLTGAGRAALLRATLRRQPRTASRRQQRAAWRRDPERRRRAADIRCDGCSGLCVRQLRDPARSRHGRRDRGAGRRRRFQSRAQREFTVASANLERFFDEQDDPNHDDVALTPDAVNLRLQKASLTVRHVLRSARHSRRRRGREPLHPAEAGCEDQRRMHWPRGKAIPMYVAYLEEGNDIGGIDSGFLVKSARVERDQRGADRQGCDVHAAGQAPGGPASAPERSAATRAESGGHGPPWRRPSRSRSSSITSARSAGSTARTAIGSVQSGGRRRSSSPSLIQAHQATERVISVGDYNAFPFNDGFVDVDRHHQGQRRRRPIRSRLPARDLVDPDLTNLGDSARSRTAVLVRVRWQRAGARSHPREQPRASSDSPASATLAATRTSRNRCAAMRPRPERCPITTRRSPISRSRRAGRHARTASSPLDVEAFTSFTDPGATAHDDEGPLPVTTSGQPST